MDHSLLFTDDPVSVRRARHPDPHPRHIANRIHVANLVTMSWQHIERGQLAFVRS